MVSPIRYLLAGLVVFVPMTVVWVNVVTTDFGRVTTATYRSLEFSAHVLYLTRKLQLSNTSESKVTWGLSRPAHLDNGAYVSTKHLIKGTHDHLLKSTSQVNDSQLQDLVAEILTKSNQRRVLMREHIASAGWKSNVSWTPNHTSTARHVERPSFISLNTEIRETLPGKHQHINLTGKGTQNLVEPDSTDDPSKAQLKHLTRLSRTYNFTLPCRSAYKPVTVVMKAVWVKPLLEFLSRCKSKQVTLVIANTAYKEILLNWLISATIVSKPPMENVLVASLDLELHDTLNHRGLNTIWVPFSSMLKKERLKKNFEFIMMIRLGLMRLISYFGYDCAMYDIDAIVLRNPQQLYTQYQSDIVSSRGTLPKELMKKWHVTMCIGAVFIRSNYRTEKFWDAVSRTHLRKQNENDQIRLNHGLDALEITWSSKYREDQTSEMYGRCRNNLTITVLPLKFICRYGCHTSMRNQYYIWHKGGDRDQNSKMAGAAKGHTWFLRKDWEEVLESDETMKGLPWLQNISIYSGT